MQLNLQNSLLTFLDISKKSDFKKPSSWPDIRKNAPANSIRLLVDNSYPIGLIATVTGGYSVDIDGVNFTDKNSNEQLSISSWEDYTETEGYPIDYPTECIAHIIDIYPQTEGNSITAFHCARVAASGTEQQGVLWTHFNLKNNITISKLASSQNNYVNRSLISITALNNKINFTGSLTEAFYYCVNLEYLPVLESKNNSGIDMPNFLTGCSKIKNVYLKNTIISSAYGAFSDCTALENIKGNNTSVNISHSSLNNMYGNCKNLKKILPATYTSSLQRMTNYLYNCKSLEDTVIDVRGATNLKNIDCYGTSTNFAAGIKGLRVSNQAPFDYGTAPQINVSYTGMDRQALVTLFNDLPTVTGGQKINIVGCSGAADLTADDKAIATDKGWILTIE